jgi:hypothetical protein
VYLLQWAMVLGKVSRLMSSQLQVSTLLGGVGAIISRNTSEYDRIMRIEAGLGDTAAVITLQYGGSFAVRVERIDDGK